ncbi:hypothetical protein [Lacticaseibacillus sp. N501-2]|uniref:hypothetical protein n=1 Tax=Lacticaseibacillus salsurae TaxID=3367729 RepID=UPI0038B4100F
MPFLLIPIFLIIIGVVMLCVIGLVFGLVHLLFWPVVIGLFIWWLVSRSDHHHHTHHQRTDWQDGLHERKAARNVHEEKQTHHDDDWSDF